MKIKPLIIISIGLLVCALLWILLKPNTETKPLPVPRDLTSESPVNHHRTSKFAVNPQGIPEIASAETLAQRDRERLTELNQAIGFADHPYAQEIQEAINSPEFVEFQKQPFSMKRWFDYLESQGVKSYSNMYTEIWQNLFPESDLSDYTKVIEDHLVEEILSTELVGLPGSLEREIQIMNIYDEEVLQSSDQNIAWHNATFMTDEDPQAWVKWAVNIAENASPPAPSALEDVDSVLRPAENTTTATQDVAENTMIEDVDSVLRPEDDEKKAPLERLDPSSEYREHIESELLTEIRLPPLESAFQQFQQNEQFS